ncbi:MAG: SIR2 family protein [Tumebacillaceae bacterium]
MIDWPVDLVHEFALRRVVLYLGAGVSCHATSISGDRPPLWGAFLQEAVSQLDSDTSGVQRLLNENDYLTACELILNKMGKVRFAEYARTKFLRPGFQYGEIHRHIYDLDARIVATPNVDKIYDTYASTTSSGTIITRSYSDSNIAELLRVPDQSVIIKVHGTIDDANNMIFTRKQYAEARYKHSTFYAILNALALTHTFVFIGCGYNDPDIRLVLENYAFNFPHCKPHYMLCSEDSVDGDMKTVLQENCNLEVISYSPINNHVELTRSLGALVGLVSEKRDNVALTQKW